MMLARRLSAVVLLVGLAAVPALAQKIEERVDRTLPFQTGGTLRLKTFSGTVEILGTQGSEVVVHAIRRAEADKLRDIRFDIQTSGDTITINANEHDDGRRNENVVEADIQIQVPVGTRLDIKSFSAPVTVRNVDGASEVDTFSGTVVVEAATWPDGQALDVKTFSGDIELHVPADARGQIAFDTFSGDLSSDLPLTFERARGGRNVRGTFNGGGSGRVRLKTFSGDAAVRR